MKARGLVLATVGSLLLIAASSHAVTQWPDIPEPPRSRVEWVAADMKIDGLPSRIEHFDSELSPDEILGFYRSRWSRATVGAPQSVSAGGWRALSTVQGRFQLIVQVREKKPQGSEGLLSVANFGEVRGAILPSNWPRWSDVRTTQVAESTDGPKRSILVAMISTEGFDINVRRWRDEWTRRGFGLVLERSLQSAPGVQSWVASFDKPPQMVDVAISYRQSDRRTFVSVNLIEPLAAGFQP